MVMPPIDPMTGQPMMGQPPMGDPTMGQPMPPMGAPAPQMGPQMGPPVAPAPVDPMMAAPPMGSDIPEPEPELDLESLDDLAPIYPAWLVDRRTKKPKPPKKPTSSYCRDAVASDEMTNHTLLDRFRNDLRTYRKQEESVFEDLDPDDIELYTSAEPALQVDKIANMISGIDHVITFPWKNPEEETKAQALENFSYHFLEEIDKHHRLGGNASYVWDAVWYRAIYGRIITRVLPDPEDPDFPWDVRLYDPATVFPVFGTKRGLSRVSCVYSETLDKVLQTYGDNPKVYKELMAKFQNQEDGSVPLNRSGVIREYWDAWYRWVEFDGIELMDVTAHELGRVPFIYTMGTGEAGGASLPKAEKLTLRERQGGLSLGQNAGDPNLANKGLSFFHHMMPAIRQEGAIYSILMTSAKQALAPPTGVESPYEDPPEPIDMSTGATNKLRPGEKYVPLLSSARPTDIGPLIQSFREQRVKAGLPDQMFGALEGSNVSGFAVESLIAAAKDRIQPVIDDLEFHLADVLDMALYDYRNFCHLYVEDLDGSYPIPTQGRKITAPKNTPNRPQASQMMQVLMGMAQGMPTDFSANWDAMGFDNTKVDNPEAKDMRLTREMILAIGTRPKVKLHTVQLQNMTQLANVANMLIESKVWSRTTAMEEMNIKNPQQEWQRILQEDAQTNPKMLELVMFPQALWESGNISAFISYFATVVMPNLMGMMAPPAPEDGGDPALAQGPQTAQGASQPQMGASPGRPADGGGAMM